MFRGKRSLVAILLVGAALAPMTVAIAHKYKHRYHRGGGHPHRPHTIDVDHDGVPDDRDRCLQTPRRARAIANGCAAFEIVANPEIVGAPVQAAIATALSALEARDVRGAPLFGSGVNDVREHLEVASERFEQGLGVLATGKVCRGAEVVSAGRDRMEEASRGIGEALLGAREALQRQVSPDDGDADAFEVMFHELGYRAGLVGNALVVSRHLDEAVQGTCGQVQGDLAIRGIIARTDEAAGVIRMRNGRYFAMADGMDSEHLYERAAVRVEGVRFRDTHGVVREVRPLPNDRLEPSLVPGGGIRLVCASLQIAPFQPFSPPLPSVSNYVLHEPLAYTSDSGSLLLEAPMRLAAKKGGCPTTSDGTGARVRSFRYSLKLEFKLAGEADFVEIASDLAPGDDPMPFPSSALPTMTQPITAGTLRVTEQGQACVRFFRRRCSSTAKELATREFNVFILQGGAFGSASYVKTLFDLEDWDANAFRLAQFDQFNVHVALGSLPVSFEAEGYSPFGVKTLVPVRDSGNHFFSIFRDDFFGPNDIFAAALHGTSKPSGLRWPRIVGVRHGRPFWYTAKIPSIVRDLVATCSPGPHSFYRLPWRDGTTVGVGQGNADTVSHFPNSSQEFAFDFSLTDGQVIRAVRGGSVEWFQETQSTNYNPFQPTTPNNQPFPQGSTLNWGNTVRIEHQDGTFAWYFHIRQNGVIVTQGQQVQRGQPIAFADNTGRSTNAHLHHQVQADNANWGQSIRIRFATGDTPPCYIPQTGDTLLSNNYNPNFPADPVP